MFKKVIIIIVMLFPFWYSLLIGYPVISDKQYNLNKNLMPNVSISKRCFGVGDFKGFIDCLKSSQMLNGVAFIEAVTEKTNQISILLTATLITTIIIFIVFSVLI